MNTKTMTRWLSVGGLLLIALVGCGSSDPQTIELRGRLVLAEADDEPPGAQASARVTLTEQGTQTSDDRIVVERTLHDLNRMPVAFRVAVDRALVDSGNDYALSAEIVGADGNTLWQTPAPTPIALFDDPSAVELTLKSQRLTVDSRFKIYQCSDGFRFRLAHDDRAAIVHLGQRQLSLHAAPSISVDAKRYIDNHYDEIVMGGGVTSIYFDGVSHHDCEPVPADAEQPAQSS